MVQAVHLYFEKYGKIDTITVHSKKKSGYALIQFESVESASAAIAKPQHEINGKLINVEAAHYWLQPKIQPSRPKTSKNVGKPDKTTSREVKPNKLILDLNDGCLIELFKYLPISDLKNAFQVCTKFQSIAKSVFKDRFNEFGLMMHEYSSKNQNGYLAVDQKLFRYFGSAIKSLWLNFKQGSPNFNQQLIDCMLKYCIGPNDALTELTIDNFDVTPNQIQLLQPIFKRLTILSISSGKIDRNVANLIGASRDLVELRLSQINFNNISHLKFDKLNELSLGDGNQFSDENFIKFIRTHSNIKSLRIHMPNDRMTTNICRSIATNLKALEVFECSRKLTSSDENCFSPLAELKHLKKLHLNCSSLSVKELFNALADKKPPITWMTLSNLNIDLNMANDLAKLNKMENLFLYHGNHIERNQLLTILGGMPNLKSLSLMKFGQLNADNVKAITAIATNLNELYLSDQLRLKINEDDFIEMVEMIKMRKNKVKLGIEIDGERCKLKVPDEIMEENEQWLEISCEMSDDIWEYNYDDSDSDNDSIREHCANEFGIPYFKRNYIPHLRGGFDPSDDSD